MQSLAYANPMISVTPDQEPSPATKRSLEAEGMHDYELLENLRTTGGACNTDEFQSDV